jgi:hypothetical protein
MEFKNFENFQLNEALKSTIVKRLQKEPYTKSVYKDGKYVDENKFKVTSGFQKLGNYDLEKIDDSYFTQVPKDRVNKKPYAQEYLIFCFKDGKYVGYFEDTFVSSENGIYSHRGRRGRSKRTEYSRKGIIDHCDEFWAFDQKRAQKEASRNSINQPRRDARDNSVADYLGGTHNHNRYASYNNYEKGLNGARKAFNDKVKKDNVDRYYKEKSKSLDFVDVYDILQVKLKRAYKQIAHGIEEAKHDINLSEYSINFGKVDPAVARLLELFHTKSAGHISDIAAVLKGFHGLYKQFVKLRDEGQRAGYGYNNNSENEKLIKTLKYIQSVLRKSEEKEKDE